MTQYFDLTIKINLGYFFTLQHQEAQNTKSMNLNTNNTKVQIFYLDEK